VSNHNKIIAPKTKRVRFKKGILQKNDSTLHISLSSKEYYDVLTLLEDKKIVELGKTDIYRLNL
jgi:hypothetical protein